MNTILIIEDESQIRENIQEILDLEGFVTITAEDGWLGIKMAQQHQPNLIICDLMMPRLDGYGVIKALRQQPVTAEIPLIFLTAKAEHHDLRQAMELGADDYLTKPFEPNELLRVISVQLEKRQIVTQRYKGQIKQMENQINYLARHDSLTGLPNQFFLEEYFNQTRLQAYNQGKFLPLLLMDIDILYRTRLCFDPSLRNLLLKTVGERLNQLNFPNLIIDLIAYLKTDQLALLLKPVQDSKVAAGIAEQILDSLSQPLIINNQEISVQAKIGIACYPNDALQLGELLTHAEVTLEHYKQENKTSYHFYNQEILDIVFRKVILESDFWQALERNEFQLYYQPQINIKTKKIVGVEALIRWLHPEYGMISPAEFIPMAEESGFIIPLGEWIIKTACSQLQNLQLEGLGNFNVAVNISAYQFRQENFIQHINEIMTSTNFNLNLLELELTETVFVQDIEVVKRKMNELKNHGIKLSIDDFGTGYSSFKYLQEFSFNHLKIDRYFISNIDKLENKQSIVKSIIQLADSLNINIIAEGVETNEELNWLKQNHCSIIQGYFFSRPLGIEDLKIFLLANN
ncbi:EAL domain-containing protein [Trichormus sp. NMC-1]|uniref:putative bifunctional diguanylate cyclase/phosphodiesterase n=1 Tax=Trichormus sp. NMC-1 TaxID=1853259 RepID=UPI0008DC2BE8|nr:EAL domain-containing protein [Trichormus sp. NMC-1]